MITVAETFSVKTDEGVQALDPQQILAVLNGRGVVSGGGVHDGTDPFSLDVFSTQAFFAATDNHPATTVSRQAASIDLQSYIEPFAPKKVVICVPREAAGNAAAGDYHVIEGETAQPEPSGALGRNTAKPSLPDLVEGGSGDLGGIVPQDLVPLAAAYLDAGASEIDGDDPQMVWDRRQPVDVKFRRVEANRITAVEIEDGSGTVHGGELADAADIRTDSQIIGVVNDDPDHGSRDTGVGASHEYRTDSEIRNVVSSSVDAADLQGAAGTNGQILFTDGTNTNWASPPASWGDPFDQTLNTSDSPQLAGLTVGSLDITGDYTWPDDTGGTSSPSAQAGGVSVLSDLGDVQQGEFADRPAASGSGDFFFAYESGVYYDRPSNNPAAWEAVAKHPLMIQSASELGFDVATQSELDTHAGAADAHHTRYDEAIQDVESHADPLAIDITGDAATLGNTGPSGYLSSGSGDLTFENGILTHWNGHSSIHGKRSAGENERWVGNTADYLVTIQDGTKRVNHVWNAYYDGTDWRYQVGDEPAHRLKISNDGGWDMQTAASSLSGEIINWKTATINNGSINQADNATSLGGYSSSRYGRARPSSDVNLNSSFSYDHRVSFNAPEIRSNNSFGAYHIDIVAFGNYLANTDPIYISIDGAVINDDGEYLMSENVITSINATNVKFEKDGTENGDIAVTFDQSGAILDAESRIWGDLWLTRPVR